MPLGFVTTGSSGAACSSDVRTVDTVRSWLGDVPTTDMIRVVARLRFHLTIARSPIDAGGVVGGASIGGC